MALTYDEHLPVSGHGRTMLLSSGLGGSAAFWAPQLPALLQAGWRVLTYDHRGTGRNAGPLPDGHDIGAMAQDVLEVMDASQTAHCHFMGHALGGLAGLQLALDAPQRVHSLTLINAWATLSAHTARCFAARLALLEHGGAQAYVDAQAIFLYPADWAEAHAQQVDREQAHALAHFPPPQTLQARIRALQAFDISARLGEISQPCLVMTCMDDILVPWSCSKHLSERLPVATLHRMAHGGHAHSVTRPAAFNRALLQFLQGICLPGEDMTLAQLRRANIQATA